MLGWSVIIGGLFSILQKVTDIFHSIVYETEKAEGNIQEKSGCVLS